MAKAPNWTDAECATVIAMRQDGKTAREIGAALGRSRQAVLKRLNILGIKMPPEHEQAMRLELARRVRAHPNYGEKRSAAIKAAITDERREKAGALARELQIWKKGNPAQSIEDKRKGAAAGRAKWSAQSTGWCPAHLLADYRKFAAKMPAAEARRIITDEWSTQLYRTLRQIADVANRAQAQAQADATRRAEEQRAWRRSFAGQMEAVKAGAALVRKINPKTAGGADYSLTGNSMEMF